MTPEQVEQYYKFIQIIQSRIDKFFDNQKEYIYCKEGCARCCKNGEYPCSWLEFEFLKLGFMTSDKSTQDLIIRNILNVKALKASHQDEEKFTYECPFLINDRCSVYKYRMIICRTFGLPYYDEKEQIKIPFCTLQGLNYSDVYDTEKKQLSNELFQQTGHKVEPLAYNLSLNFLMEKVGKDALNLYFGEEKPLIDWL